MATVLIASDSPVVRRDIRSVIASPEHDIIEASSGPEVIARCKAEEVDLAIVDLQMSNMGAMAVCLELRLEESYDQIDHVKVLMLLDRRADVFLARRSDAEGFVVKPLDGLRVRRAVKAVLAGERFEDDSFLPSPVLVADPATGA